MRSGTRSGSACCRSGGSLVSRFPRPQGWSAFFLLAALELCVPLWAEQAGRTAWHPGHIAERYGLFTIIVLGESVLSATVGVQTAIDLDSKFSDLGLVVVGGLLTLFTMWWIYFDLPTEHLVERIRADFEEHLGAVFAWGYGHYFVFASIAATGAGLVVAIDQLAGHSELTDVQAAFAFTLPVSLYVLSVWALHARATRPRRWCAATHRRSRSRSSCCRPSRPSRCS